MPLRLPACSPPPVPLPPVLLDFLNDPPPALVPVLRAAEPYACHLIYASSALVALIILRSTYTRFRAFLRQDEPSGMLTVKWGKDRFTVPLPSPGTPLAALRITLAEHTGLAPNAFKLICAGAVLKDDNAPISAYNLRPTQPLLLLESSPTAAGPAPPSKPPVPRTEQDTIARIRAELSTSEPLARDVDAFLALPALQPQEKTQMREKNTPPTPEETQEHARLAELLLQALLRLDALALEGGWEDARRERKGAVRHVQGLLDRLDGAWRVRVGA